MPNWLWRKGSPSECGEALIAYSWSTAVLDMWGFKKRKAIQSSSVHFGETFKAWNTWISFREDRKERQRRTDLMFEKKRKAHNNRWSRITRNLIDLWEQRMQEPFQIMNSDLGSYGVFELCGELDQLPDALHSVLIPDPNKLFQALDDM